MEIVNVCLGLLFITILIFIVFRSRTKKNILKSEDASKYRIFFDKQLINQEEKDTNIESNEIDSKVIAAISSAVAYCYLDSNKTYKIHSIKRIFYADDRA